MQENEIIKVAIAETSVIIRTGTALVLKKIQGLKLMPIEIVSPDNLIECLRFHKPDVLVMNPAFPGHFDVRGLKQDMQVPDMKCVALVCSVTDQNILRDYDESVSLYDAPEVLIRALLWVSMTKPSMSNLCIYSKISLHPLS